MRIRRLELHGFKSFVDRTVLQFAPGINCVVGPNGCGKSNLIDAIKWVLGESSARSLRGGQMQDVIFGGSEHRAPTGMAEVSLVIDNRDRTLGGEFGVADEVQVGRRLYRSGDAEYLINQVKARRKDILTLFLDTGVGARAYAIIEQGRIGRIVSARPEERRFLIEEAAGISRFQVHREEAARKLASTEQNLEQLDSVGRELRRQARGLRRQAERAQQFRALSATAKRLDLFLSLARTRGLVERFRDQFEQVESLREAERSQATDVATREAELTAVRERLRQLSADLERGRAKRTAKLHEAQLARREGEHEVRRADELAGRQVRLAGVMEGLRARLLAMKAEEERHRGELKTSGERLREAEAQLRDLNNTRSAQQQALVRDREALAARRRAELAAINARARARARLGELDRRARELVARRERAGRDRESAEERLGRRRREENARAEALRTIESGRETQAQAVAEARIEAEASRAQQASEERAERDAQRRHATAQGQVASLRKAHARFQGLAAAPRALLAASIPGVIGPVSELLQVPEPWEAAVERALAPELGSIVVRDPEAAEAAAALLERRRLGQVELIIASRCPAPPAESSGLLAVVGDTQHRGVLHALLGDIVLDGSGSEGRVLEVGGRLRDAWRVRVGGGARSGLLSLARELAEAESELATAAEHLERARAERQLRRQSDEAAREQLERARAALQRAELTRVGAQRDLTTARSERARAEQALQRLDRSDRELDHQERQLAREREQLSEAEQVELPDPTAGPDLEAAISRLEAAQAAVLEQIGEARARVAEARAGRRAAEQALAQLHAERGRTEEQLRTHEDELAGAGARIRDWRARGAELSANAQRLTTEAETLDAEIAVWQAQRKQVRGVVEQRQSELEARRHTLAATANQLQRLQLEVAELRVEVGHLQESILERFGLDLHEVIAELEEAGTVELLLPGLPSAEAPPPRADEPVADTPPGQEAAPEGQPPAQETAAVEEAGISATLAWDELADVAAQERARKELKTARQTLERIGQVNLGAPAELAAVEERLGFIESQEEDLRRSVAAIRKAIQRIDRDSRRRFKETFEQVDGHFRSLYPRLSGGGRGYLELTDPKDLLATGLELKAQPPGKKLQSIRLMSGGEKAMTALALIFAIFRVKPSPFCLLDEVDAPLDAANTARFAQLLREIATTTQLIVITHNQKTMEVGETMYGITMQDPGISRLVSVRMEGSPDSPPAADPAPPASSDPPPAALAE